MKHPERRFEGLDWPFNALTMVGLKRLENLQECVEGVIADGVPGDLIETGVWRGGAGILMRALLHVHGVTDRRVWLADSFAGLPPPSPDYPADAGLKFHEEDHLAVSLDKVKENFAKYGMLDEQVCFLEGWFSDTLPTVRDRTWSIVRLDGDMYESTIVALENLYPGLSPGGFLIVDDYGKVAQCRQAVDDYRAEHGIEAERHDIDGAGMYWRKD